MKYTVLSAAIIALALTACQKKEAAPADNSAAPAASAPAAPAATPAAPSGEATTSAPAAPASGSN
ncbi:MAG: hypothetical protein KGQ58_04555 [Proteobacteria bacterium]|nr:hypothetical protein [Pseudomonadota bacterium]